MKAVIFHVNFTWGHVSGTGGLTFFLLHRNHRSASRPYVLPLPAILMSADSDPFFSSVCVSYYVCSTRVNSRLQCNAELQPGHTARVGRTLNRLLAFPPFRQYFAGEEHILRAIYAAVLHSRLPVPVSQLCSPPPVRMVSDQNQNAGGVVCLKRPPHLPSFFPLFQQFLSLYLCLVICALEPPDPSSTHRAWALRDPSDVSSRIFFVGAQGMTLYST